MRQFVHEAFDVDGVVVDVDAAPEAGRDVRIAHAMSISKFGTEYPNAASPLSDALEGRGIHAVDQRLRPQREQDRLTGYPHVQAGQVVVGIEGAGQLAMRDRMIVAVLHVFFARPQQLDRSARHLLGDRHRLPDIVGLAAPAETAAEHDLVDFAFVGRKAAGFQHRGESRFAVLRSAPDFAFVRSTGAVALIGSIGAWF